MGGTTSHPINPGYWLLLSHHHLDVLSESWMKWGWLAEGTAKFEKPNPEIQLTVGKQGHQADPGNPREHFLKSANDAH